MVSNLKTFTNKWCKFPAHFFFFFFSLAKLGVVNHLSLSQFSKDQEVLQQGSGGYTTRIKRLYNKDQEVIQQGSGSYTIRIKRLLAGFFLVSVLLSALVKRCFVSRMRDFYEYKNPHTAFLNTHLHLRV